MFILIAFGVMYLKETDARLHKIVGLNVFKWCYCEDGQDLENPLRQTSLGDLVDYLC